MKKASSREKVKNVTSIMVQFQGSTKNNQKKSRSVFDQLNKSEGHMSAEYSRQFVEGLLSRLVNLQTKQKLNELKFQDCINSLKKQIEIKEKINVSLKQEIIQLKSQLVKLRYEVQNVRKGNHIKQMNRVKKLPSSSHIQYRLNQKQNVPSYLVQSVKMENKQKKTPASTKRSDQKRGESSLERIPFKLEDFVSKQRVKNLHEDYNMNGNFEKIICNRNNEKVTSSCKRSFSNKVKSKSIGGLLKSKLFAK